MPLPKPSTVRVAEVNAPAIAAYKQMREAILNDAGNDRTLCEVVIAMQLAVLGSETAFKIHSTRLLDLAISKRQIEQLILAGLGVTMTVAQSARALEWFEDACEAGGKQ